MPTARRRLRLPSPVARTIRPGRSPLASGRRLQPTARRPRASACTRRRRPVPRDRAGVARESRRPRTSANQAHPCVRAARDGGYGTLRHRARPLCVKHPAPAKPVWRRGSALTRTVPGSGPRCVRWRLRTRNCPQRGLTKMPRRPRPFWKSGCVASQSKLRNVMPATHSTPTRVASMLPIRIHAVTAALQSQERPGHLSPVEEVGHLHSPLPDPRSHAAASRLDRATSVEFPGEGIGPPGCACRWPRRRNDVLVRDHLAVGDLRRIGRPSTRRPRSRLPHPSVVAPEPSNCSRSRTTAWPVSRLSPSVHLPTTPSLRRTVACMVCSSLFVNAEISNELPAALGQKEQLKRSAKASAATTLDRTLTKHSTICAICHNIRIVGAPPGRRPEDRPRRSYTRRVCEDPFTATRARKGRRRPRLIAAMLVGARWLSLTASRVCMSLFDCHPRPERSREFVRTPCPARNEGASHVCDHSPLRRCGPESLGRVDQQGQRDPRPQAQQAPGFAGYYLIEAGNGVFSSLSLFETAEQGTESTKIVATWLRDEKLETMIPNEPKITSGKVVAHSDRVLVAA